MTKSIVSAAFCLSLLAPSISLYADTDDAAVESPIEKRNCIQKYYDKVKDDRALLTMSFVATTLGIVNSALLIKRGADYRNARDTFEKHSRFAVPKDWKVTHHNVFKFTSPRGTGKCYILDRGSLWKSDMTPISINVIAGAR